MGYLPVWIFRVRATVGTVTTSRVAVVGRVAQLLVLACTLLGLAAMHTIGHTGLGHHHAAGHDAVPAAADAEHLFVARLVIATMHDAAAVTSRSVPPTGPDGCAGDGCTPTAGMPGGAGGGMAGWDLCVAVLSALAVATLLTVLLLSVVAGRAPPRPDGTAHSVARAGPSRAGLGLRLTAVSVLRI